MGKLLIPILLSVFVTFSLQIKEKVKVQTEVVPSIYQLLIEVETEGKTEGEVLNTLTAVDNGVKALNIPYKGGYFEVFPLRVYDKNTDTYKVTGFKGSIRYKFLTKEPTQTEKVFYLLENVKRNYPVIYRVLGQGWVVPEEVLEKKREQLREKLIEKIEQLKKFYSKEFRKECEVKRILFEEGKMNFYPTYRSISSPIPQREKENISLAAEVVFECH